MMLYPEIQTKFQEELDQVIGSDRFVTMDDKPKLHYVSAVIQVSVVIFCLNNLLLGIESHRDKRFTKCLPQNY